MRPSRRFALKAPGYSEGSFDRFLTPNLIFGLKDGNDYTPSWDQAWNGAGDRDRTGDIQLGKLAFYR